MVRSCLMNTRRAMFNAADKANSAARTKTMLQAPLPVIA
jgi:hypothetical protein